VLDSLGSQSFDSDSRLSIVNDITMAKEDQSAFDIIELGKWDNHVGERLQTSFIANWNVMNQHK